MQIKPRKEKKKKQHSQKNTPKIAVKIRELKNALRKKNHEIKNLRKKLEKVYELEQIIEAMKKYLTPDEHRLVAMQMRLTLKKRKVYSDEFRAFAVQSTSNLPSATVFFSPVSTFLQSQPSTNG